MTLEIFAYFHHSGLWKTGEKILELSEVKLMSLAPSDFDVDQFANIRSGLSITILEKKHHKITENSDLEKFQI